MANIELKNVNKFWGNVNVIQDLNLSIAEGEFMVLLGSSGCGKTTTMRMIAGLEEPSNGDVYIGGERVNDKSPNERDVAMVFQNYGLYPNKTVYHNIAFPLVMKKTPKNMIDGYVKKAAEYVELTPLLDRKPAALSGGQRQRVALARAIVREPKLFLMDEPLSNLDAKLRVTMRALLKHLHYKFKRTTVYVTHDQIEAMTLADKVALMHQGKVEQMATPKEIYDNPNSIFVAGFIGSYAMNFIKGEIRGSCFVAPDFSLPLSSADKSNVTFGIRPNKVSVCDLDSATVKGKVYAVEVTGESSLITVSVGESLVVAYGDRNTTLQIGENVGLSFQIENSYLFDSLSGKRIYN